MSKQSTQTSHDILEVFNEPESSVNPIYTFETSELTAECPFDFGGPDYYQFTLRYIPDTDCIESRSLKKYIEAFRERQLTVEELAAEIYQTLDRVIAPIEMYIRLEQARRGGIEETVELGDLSLK